MNLTTLKRHLREAEGFRSRPYQDTVGVWTIGFGHALHGRMAHEVQHMKWTRAQANKALDVDIADALHDATSFPWFETLDEVRQRVIVELCFNLGRPRVLGFRKMLAALAAKDYARAADELKDSRWYVQVGPIRGNRMVNMLRTGAEP